MDNHALSLTLNATHDSFEEEYAHQFLGNSSHPWLPIGQPQFTTDWSDHAAVNWEPFPADYVSVEPDPRPTEPPVDGQLMTGMSTTCNATPWSGYDTRTPWTCWDAGDAKLSTSMQDISIHAPSQWLVDNGSATFSDDGCSVRTGGVGEHMSNLPWNPTMPFDTHVTQRSCVPSSTTTSRADSCFYEASSEWGDAPHQYDLTEVFADNSIQDAHAFHEPDAVPTNMPKEPPYICQSCSRPFQRQPDRARHRKAMHEGTQGYRCPVEECSKAGKTWKRLDSFRQHVSKRHRGTDVQRLVNRSSSRARSGANTDLLFSVTTPALMQRKHFDKH